MSNEPTLRRKFQLTNLDGNNNKFWMIEQYPDGSVVTTYGRVGDEGQCKEWGYKSPGFVDSKIYEKTRKGYREVDLHKPAVVSSVTPAASGDPKVVKLVQDIFTEANERIQTYLATSVDALSQHQIAQGRSLLSDIVNVYQKGMSRSLYSPRQLVERYYNTIPTQLPRKIDPLELVARFDIQEQETRLDQLEAALSTYTVQQQGGTQIAALGAELKHIPESHQQYAVLRDLLDKTLKSNGVRIKDIFAVKLPQERAAYDAETFGAHKVDEMFHGTRNPNVRHILNQGLRLPRSAANGWRLGAGIYFSHEAWRSYQYTANNSYHIPKMMFIASVKVGNWWETTGSDQSLRAAPKGYHSTRGLGTWSNRGDEVVVYKASQATLRAIVTVE